MTQFSLQYKKCLSPQNSLPNFLKFLHGGGLPFLDVSLIAYHLLRPQPKGGDKYIPTHVASTRNAEL